MITIPDDDNKPPQLDHHQLEEIASNADSMEDDPADRDDMIILQEIGRDKRSLAGSESNIKNSTALPGILII